jgi:hypothetical protein
MSVYGYSIEKEKVKFNIHFSSYQTNSYTGPRYNAIYNVNLRGHLDVSDFQKAYDVRLILESTGTSDATATGIDPNAVHAVHVDFGGNFANISAFRERCTPCFIAHKTFYNLTDNTLVWRFDSRYGDNSPIRVKSLYGFDTLGFNLFDVNGQASLTNSTVQFHFILAFEEV